MLCIGEEARTAHCNTPGEMRAATHRPAPLSTLSSHTFLPHSFPVAPAVVEQCWASRRPLLIGTTSVTESEAILTLLERYASPEAAALHLGSVQILNAKPDKVRSESEVIAQVGQGFVPLLGGRGLRVERSGSKGT